MKRYFIVLTFFFYDLDGMEKALDFFLSDAEVVDFQKKQQMPEIPSLKILAARKCGGTKTKTSLPEDIKKITNIYKKLNLDNVNLNDIVALRNAAYEPDICDWKRIEEINSLMINYLSTISFSEGLKLAKKYKKTPTVLEIEYDWESRLQSLKVETSKNKKLLERALQDYKSNRLKLCNKQLKMGYCLVCGLLSCLCGAGIFCIVLAIKVSEQGSTDL